ncbi:MAG TPA: vanadium-dependent haloperoxidase, partial [Longimicrobiales bacterium]|nr:vanadium-dependent haloperoxidase [Longimicrobiales bacterium]
RAMFRHGPDKSARRGALAALVALIALAAPLAGARAAEPPQSADTVREWNLHASDALINASNAPIPGAGQAPHVSQLHLAMVQGAVYDAVNSIDGGHQPYLAGLPPASPSASREAAVATAAHDVLVGLGGGLVPPLPQVVIDRLDALYADELEGIPVGDVKTDGIAAGAAAAAAMLEARADDGRYGPFRFTSVEPTVAGKWQTTPPAFVNDPFAWVARVEPFVIESPSQFRTKGPHALKTDAYTREYNEVKDLGTAGSPRSARQEAVARFYTVNPPELFNRTFRAIGADRGLTLAGEARLFAMLNVAGADGLINCWNDKAHWSNWRPITAIREGDNDGNPSTVGDPGWTPLIATPPYPEHASGYNCETSAFMHTAEAFFGRGKTEFSVVRIVPGVPNVTRNYERFTDVIDDTIDARVYQGIHFRAADVQGAEIGKDVAHWLGKHYFQPVK